MSRITWGKAGAAEPVEATAWEYQALNDGRWINFHPTHSNVINRAACEGAESVTLHIKSTPYVLDMGKSVMAAFGSDFNFHKNSINVRRAVHIV